MNIGEKIRFYRKKNGLTQKQLADLCGIAEPNLRKYELGKQNPKLGTLKKISAALDIKTTDILVDELNINEEKISTQISFIDCLSYLGYSVTVCKVGESSEGHYEQVYDENLVKVGDIWLPDEEHFKIKICKNNIEMLLSEKDFDKLKDKIIHLIDFEIYKHQDK